jgi:hypothetical protein
MAKGEANASGASQEGVLEGLEELAPKHLGQYDHGHEKARTGSDPVIVSWVETTPRNDAMDVGMKSQGLRPGVKDGDGSWGHSQTALAHGMERSYGSLEEQRVGATPLCQEEGVQGRGHSEDHVEIRYRKEASRLNFHPPGLLQALTLGTMAVPAGVVEGLFSAAVIAHLEMATQKRRSTHHDVADDPTTIAP